MVGAAAACFVVVLWLSYDTQDVEYTAPTTPKPSETFPCQHLAGCDHPRMPSTCETSSQEDSVSHMLGPGGGSNKSHQLWGERSTAAKIRLARSMDLLVALHHCEC